MANNECLAAYTGPYPSNDRMVPYVNVTRCVNGEPEPGEAKTYIAISVRDTEGKQVCAFFSEEGWADFKKQVVESK